MDNQEDLNKHQPSTSTCGSVQPQAQKQHGVCGRFEGEQEAAASRLGGGDTVSLDGDCYWSDSVTSNCDPSISSPTNTTASGGGGDQQNSTSSSQNPRSVAQSRRCNTTGTTITNRNVRKRTQANERERERTRALNQALEILRNRLPVQESEKRSKIQTLRTAKEYIEFLARLERLSQQQEQCDLHQQEEAYNNSANNSTNNQYNKLVAGDGGSVQPATGSNQPDSPFTYKFYKFRLKSHTKTD